MPRARSSALGRLARPYGSLESEQANEIKTVVQVQAIC